jgi:7-carboxy-7-deazaguanine synthase
MPSAFLVEERVNDSIPAAVGPVGPCLPVVPIAPAHRHRLRPLEGKPSGTLVIHEIYRSLQGESTFAGLPCVFIRLTACHLRCVYCDTPHAFSEGEVRVLDDIIARALELGDDLVEITGGEPLLQPEVYPLMTSLADAGKTVLLETSGAVDTAAVDPRVRIILDIKTPGSGEVATNIWSNLDRLKATDEVKVVVCDRADFDWAAKVVRERRLVERCPVLFSASFGSVNPTELASWILESRLPVRLQLQQHKILWDPAARGV